MARGAPKGNQYAKGNKGGRRKSAYKEKADANFLIDVWEGKISVSELQKTLKNKKYGAKHAFALKCLTGDMSALKKIIDKLYANKNEQDIKFIDQTDRLNPNKLKKSEREEIMRATGFLKPRENANNMGKNTKE